MGEIPQDVDTPSQTPIQELVRQDLEERQRLGIDTYGTGLQGPDNGSVPILDAYHESLDLVCYLRRIIANGGAVGRHGADDTEYVPNTSGMTPGQLLAMILDGNTQQRLDICQEMLWKSQVSYKCFIQDHEGTIEELKRKIAELSASLIRAANGIAPTSDALAEAQFASGQQAGKVTAP